MAYIDTAIQILEDTEGRLRTLISEAATTQAYREVATIAGAAEAVAALIRRYQPTESENVSGPATANDVGFVDRDEPLRLTPLRPPVRENVRRSAYPLFLRDGDFLVKVAWSKAKRRPYEHRAPREVFQTLIKYVRKRKGEGRIFGAADVLPLMTSHGEEFPSYQAYMAIGWLRQVGLLKKKGREGYILKLGAATPEKLEQLWNALPSVDAVRNSTAV